MVSSWQEAFRNRMEEFRVSAAPRKDTIALSIKVRVTSGCFHREHSPAAYAILDEYLRSHDCEGLAISFKEHESGPELLVYLALTTAGLTPAKGVIDLVTAIIKARAAGIKKGDRPSEPLELIIRGFNEDGTFYEETILRIDSRDPIGHNVVKKVLESTISKLPAKPQKKKPKTSKWKKNT